MARSFGRLFASIWDDEDFRALSVTARLLYAFLVSQSDLEHSGIIPLRTPRWARDMALSIEDIHAGLKELGEARFVVTDEVAGELLVRSLIRRDEVWKQPNVFKSAATSAKASKSAPIKAALFLEVRRLDMAAANRETQAIRDDLATHLEPFGKPSPTPPRPSGKPDGRAVADSENPDSRKMTEGAGQNPSRTPREPLANHSAGPTVKGKGNGPVLVEAFPHSPTPSPVTSREPVRALWPFALPDGSPEEGDPRENQTRDIAVLVTEIRAIRPEWSTGSVTRAVTCDSVAERPWPAVRAAALAMARDPTSEHPGRLKHDGPWWKAAKAHGSREPLPPVETHPFEAAEGGCSQCGFPKSNRRHLEAS